MKIIWKKQLTLVTVFAGLTVVSNRQTHRHTDHTTLTAIVDECIVMQPNNLTRTAKVIGQNMHRNVAISKFSTSAISQVPLRGVIGTPN